MGLDWTHAWWYPPMSGFDCDSSEVGSDLSFGCGPFTVTATTRIITYLVGDSNKKNKLHLPLTSWEECQTKLIIHDLGQKHLLEKLIQVTKVRCPDVLLKPPAGWFLGPPAFHFNGWIYQSKPAGFQRRESMVEKYRIEKWEMQPFFHRSLTAKSNLVI